MYNDNSNLAYDLSLFDVDEEAERKKAEKRREKTQMRLARKHSVGRNGNAFAVVAGVSCAAVIAFSFLHSKLQISDYTSMINETKSQIEQAESENARLNASLDSMVTLDNVEKIASEELGLQKTQNSQITFVPLNTEEMTEVAEPDTNIFVSIQNWFYDVLEYLGF